jgi:transcription elongation factor GreA
MSMSTTDTIWLTQAARDRLQAELDELAARAVEAAPQAEARMLELKSILRRAEVGDKPDDGLVEPGMVIEVAFAGDESTTRFLLARRDLTAPDAAGDLDVYSPPSPLGEAIIGTYPGDRFAYETAAGRRIEGEVVAATPFHG